MKRISMLASALVIIVIISAIIGSINLHKNVATWESFRAEKNSCEGKLSTNNIVNFIPGKFKSGCAACSLKANKDNTALVIQCSCKDPNDSTKCLNGVKGVVTMSPLDLYYDTVSNQYLLNQEGVVVSPAQLETTASAPL